MKKEENGWQVADGRGLQFPWGRLEPPLKQLSYEKRSIKANTQ